MAEQEVTYKVKLDETDLASQLSNVRNQIDATIGQAFASPTIPNIGNMDSEGPGFFNRAWETFANQASNMSLGFDQFKQDVSSIRNVISPPNQAPSFQMPDVPWGATIPNTAWGELKGSLGFGYDPTQPITHGDFKQRSLEGLAERVGDYSGNFTYTTLGSSLGFGGIIPAIAGMSTGLMLDMTANVFGSDITTRDNMAKGFQELGKYSGINLSRNAARDIAGDLVDRVSGSEFRGKGYSLEELQSNVLDFGEAGGFSNVHDAQGFQETVKGLLDNVRTVAHALGTFQEEAVQIMAELEQRGIVGTADMGTYSARMAGGARLAGMSGGAFAQTMLTGADMAIGTGLSQQMGASLAGDLTGYANQLLKTNLGSELITDYGGVGAVANKMQQQLMGYTGGPHAFLQTLGNTSGQPLILNTNELYGAIGSNMNDPFNFFRASANQSANMNDRKSFELSLGALAPGITLADAMGSPDLESTIGIISRQQGIPVQDVERMLLQLPFAKESNILSGGDALTEVIKSNSDTETALYKFVTQTPGVLAVPFKAVGNFLAEGASKFSDAMEDTITSLKGYEVFRPSSEARSMTEEDLEERLDNATTIMEGVSVRRLALQEKKDRASGSIARSNLLFQTPQQERNARAVFSEKVILTEEEKLAEKDIELYKVMISLKASDTAAMAEIFPDDFEKAAFGVMLRTKERYDSIKGGGSIDNIEINLEDKLSRQEVASTVNELYSTDKLIQQYYDQLPTTLVTQLEKRRESMNNDEKFANDLSVMGNTMEEMTKKSTTALLNIDLNISALVSNKDLNSNGKSG